MYLSFDWRVPCGVFISYYGDREGYDTQHGNQSVDFAALYIPDTSTFFYSVFLGLFGGVEACNCVAAWHERFVYTKIQVPQRQVLL